MLLSAPRMRPVVSSYRARRRAADRMPGPSALAAATAGGVAAGVLLEYFLDPAAGRRRRHQARDRAASRVRRGERRIATRARRAESHAVGIGRRTLNARRRTEPLDDVTLTQKVQSELFRRAGIDKGHISVNAEDGVVFLRGTMEHTADIQRLGEAARAIAGVREVENLLHVPGTPAPRSRSKLERQRSAS
jgi:hypothetical protein